MSSEVEDNLDDLNAFWLCYTHWAFLCWDKYSILVKSTNKQKKNQNTQNHIQANKERTDIEKLGNNKQNQKEEF